nr:hypothetical protein [Brachyspira hyodysenteriae]
MATTIIDNNIRQDILDYSAILETTVKDIHSFLEEVGRVYSFIGEKFPMIEQEMKMKKLISCFHILPTKKKVKKTSQMI